MREVINYKPDILTCCFCILVLLLDHGCQHISFPNIPHLLAQGGFGGGGVHYHRAGSRMSLGVPMQTVVPGFSSAAHNYYCYS